MNNHNPIKFDWDAKRLDMIEKTNNDPEEMKKYVLNEKNTRITKKYIEEMFKNYNIEYEVNDINIFYIAMTHPSYINKDYREMKNLKPILVGINFLKNEDLLPIPDEKASMAIPLGNTSYERLEFLGDAIIRLIISHYIFSRYDSMDEGSLTKLRSQLENSSSLADMTKRIGLSKYILLPRNLEALGARDKNNKFQCDIFEAFIAAIYFDSQKIKYSDFGVKEDILEIKKGNSFDLCFKFVCNLIEEEIDLTLLLETETNYKDELLQQFHKLGWGDPKYNVMDITVDETKMGKRYFKMYVRDNQGTIIGIGVGTSKQKGEKLAAKQALFNLKNFQDDNDDIIIDNIDNYCSNYLKLIPKSIPILKSKLTQPNFNSNIKSNTKSNIKSNTKSNTKTNIKTNVKTNLDFDSNSNNDSDSNSDLDSDSNCSDDDIHDDNSNEDNDILNEFYEI